MLAYEKAMRQLRDKYPDDFEAQTFTPSRSWPSVTPRRPTRRLSKQLQAAEILEKLWKKNRESSRRRSLPDPLLRLSALAERGLAAAQTYASIAPWVPHALHMPSHIFTRLGHVG